MTYIGKTYFIKIFIYCSSKSEQEKKNGPKM